MDIVRPLPLGDQIAAVLRREIITGTMGSETAIREEVLAERFSVSRGPIRDALKQLETERLVERAGRSYTVIGITDADIDEIYAVRRALEGLAWSEAATRPGIDVSAADTALARMREGAANHDPSSVAAADVDFHGSVVRATAMVRLIALWEILEPSIRMILEVTNAVDEDLESVVEKHALLLSALRAGDETTLRAELDTHLNASRRFIPSHTAVGER